MILAFVSFFFYWVFGICVDWENMVGGGLVMGDLRRVSVGVCLFLGGFNVLFFSFFFPSNFPSAYSDALNSTLF